MKTNPIDFLLSAVCIAMLLFAAGVCAWAISVDSAYHVVVDVLVFLFFYGLLSAVLLAVLRKFMRYPEGQFSMDSAEFTYWKLVAVLTDLAEKSWSPFTTVFTQPLIHAAFGVKAGKQAAFAAIIRDHPLIQIGDYATLGQNSVITAHAITHDSIVLKPIHIGKNAVVGINCVVMPGLRMGENAVLAPGSVTVIDTQIPPNELWGGIPAKKIKDLPVGQ